MPRALPPQALRRVRELEMKARVLSDGLLLGQYRSVFRGWGLEFEEVREYEPGDDIRAMDWNVTARTGVPHVKKFREERELTVLIAVDVSASSWFGTARSKRDLAAEIASAIGVSALRSNDRVGLVLFSDRVERFVPPRKGRDHLLRLVSELLFAEPRRTSTAIAPAARFISNVLRRRAIVFLLSDFFDSGYEGPLRVLGRRHDVIALALDDPRERELPDVGVVALEDAETGATRYVDTSSRRVREEYARAATQRVESRARAFGRMSVDRVDLSTARPFAPALMAFFASRLRRA